MIKDRARWFVVEYPLISVIVPVYNVEKYLDKCVQSLLAQTYPSYEIILVDDGSSDNCPAICDSYAGKKNNVTAYHKENGGPSEARNFGVQRAKGDWIVFADSDDYVLPNYLSDLWKLKEKHHASMAAAGIMFVDESGHKLGKKLHFDSFTASGGDAICEICLKQHIGIGAYGKLYPKEILLQIPFPVGIYCEDAAVLYQVMDSVGMVAIGDCNQNYRRVMTVGSIMRGPLTEKHIDSLKVCEEFNQYLDKKYPELSYLKPVFCCNYMFEMLCDTSMSWEEYKKIFCIRRNEFRRSLRGGVLICNRLPTKIKIKVLVLSTWPWVGKAFGAALKFRKRIKRRF